jgi:hypothetical protein
MAEEGAVIGAFTAIGRAVGARPHGWLAISLSTMAVYYLGLLASLIAKFGDLPNYVTAYDWLGNVARIFASTPDLTDAVHIAREEWLLEIGYLNTAYGKGISEWSLTLVPEKMLVILAMGMMLATIWALAAARASCGLAERGATAAATGLGAGLVGLTGATMSWVVCCAAPSWIVGLAMLGMSVATANRLAPIGVGVNIAGFAFLLLTICFLAYRQDRASARKAEIPPRPFELASAA